MRSTQRVEGMNAYFNIFLDQKVRLYEFVAQYDRALARMRVNEAETESKTENSFLVLTTPLISLEKHAAELFTRKIFSLFRHEIRKEARFGILSFCFSEMSYYASHADKDFEEAREIAFQLTSQMKKHWAIRKEGNAEAGDRNIAPKLFGVGDPNVVKTKGNPKGTSSMGKPPKPRWCGYCRYGTFTV
ncbi:hypothetical protein ACSBR2_036640 [Camellia fascicularis]